MRLAIIVGCFALVLETSAQMPTICVGSPTDRSPEISDMTVSCNTMDMEVNILLCPVYKALYNESLMVLNNQIKVNDCYGSPDWSVSPPILKFKFPLNGTSFSRCNHEYKRANPIGTGFFADYSNVPFLNISGTINSVDPSAGQITYREQILYKYSCNYPLQYLLDNTELAVSGVKVAITDNNGSFITTLKMSLFSDSEYLEPLSIPQTGLSLKTKIYVEVKATELTERFNLLLDRCYATTTQEPTETNRYDLFVGCPSGSQTKIDMNGEAQKAHFSFEAFRFVEHNKDLVSTFYLHCTTRLCEVDVCSSLKPDCERRRRRRETSNHGEDDEDIPSNATISSGPIVVGRQNLVESQLDDHASSDKDNYSGPVVAVIVCLAIVALFITCLTISLVIYLRRRKSNIA
ncbi:unnamed protein product [Ophioblennius macclurei]